VGDGHDPELVVRIGKWGVVAAEDFRNVLPPNKRLKLSARVD
jgi:hypothetical protein